MQSDITRVIFSVIYRAISQYSDNSYGTSLVRGELLTNHLTASYFEVGRRCDRAWISLREHLARARISSTSPVSFSASTSRPAYPHSFFIARRHMKNWFTVRYVSSTRGQKLPRSNDGSRTPLMCIHLEEEVTSKKITMKQWDDYAYADYAERGERRNYFMTRVLFRVSLLFRDWSAQNCWMNTSMEIKPHYYYSTICFTALAKYAFANFIRQRRCLML